MENKTTPKNIEITKMAHLILKRYEIQDEAFAYEIATSLYNNGIGFNKFDPKYYQGNFDLDEIINYLIYKKNYHQKVISIKDYLAKQTFTYNAKENAQVISFPQHNQNKFTHNRKEGKNARTTGSRNR